MATKPSRPTPSGCPDSQVLRLLVLGLLLLSEFLHCAVVCFSRESLCGVSSASATYTSHAQNGKGTGLGVGKNTSSTELYLQSKQSPPCHPVNAMLAQWPPPSTGSPFSVSPTIFFGSGTLWSVQASVPGLSRMRPCSTAPALCLSCVGNEPMERQSCLPAAQVLRM